jgi:hypothetical protein
MDAVFETIKIGSFSLVDVRLDPLLAIQAMEHKSYWKAKMIYQRGLGEQLKACRADSKPEPQHALLVFAVLRDGKFYGTWALIGLRTLKLGSGVWDVEVQMSPCLSHVQSPDYVKQIAQIGCHLLGVPLPITGGGRVQIRKWTFPDQATGEDPTHQWGVKEVPGFRELVEARGFRFKSHNRLHPKHGRTEYMESVERIESPVGFDAIGP